ncbi:MAG: veratrol--corrinoid protein metyltransferase [Coriobacteriia bacterium]|nr:veratrol--corrinoid protein metyltransferase [Coriobacteriia bacterium]
MLTTRENFLRLINKEIPEYVPTYNLFWAFNMPPFYMGERNEDGSGKDIFGVESVIDSGGINPPMPKTHDFILTDITKWRDVIKVPDEEISDSAWADAAKQAHDRHNPEIPFGGGTTMGFFQPLVSFMGFTEGLVACFEEPDEVKAMMEYLCDFAVENAKKYLLYYKPDFGFLGDDIAHEHNPFLSLAMFQDLIAPYWRRYYSIFVEAGLPVGHHNCGHFEEYLDDLVDMGVSFWDPVQSSNDKPAIKAKFGRNLAMCGGLEQRFWSEDTSEEQVRTEFRALLDMMAPGGGYAVSEGAVTPGVTLNATEAQKKRTEWMADEYNKLKFSYYE